MTTCCVCEPAGAPSLVTRETKPDLTPVCASFSEASTRPALAGIVCEDRAHCWTLTANDLIFGARRESLPQLDDGEDSVGRERDVEADQRDCLVHSRGKVSPPKSSHPAKRARYKLRQPEQSEAKRSPPLPSTAQRSQAQRSNSSTAIRSTAQRSEAQHSGETHAREGYGRSSTAGPGG